MKTGDLVMKNGPAKDLKLNKWVFDSSMRDFRYGNDTHRWPAIFIGIEMDVPMKYRGFDYTVYRFLGKDGSVFNTLDDIDFIIVA